MGIRQLCDSRVSNLKVIKSIDPGIETIYIKPPAKRSVRSVVKYADISLNTELYTINLLNEEAEKQNRIHKVIIMIEMGDLREGVLGDRVVDFYGRIFNLPNIEVVGIGTNLNCLYGIMPSQDKLIQLGLYKQLIEIRFERKIPYVSGGSSVTIPLVVKRILPACVDHFRVGESLFFGKDLFTGKLIKGMKDGIFKLHAEIIELTEKPIVPVGDIGTNVAGEKLEFDDKDLGKKAYRAILDIGLLDINIENIELVDKKITISGASSDMIVVDLGAKKPEYKVGDLIEFKLTYMGALNIMNSNYIEKKVVWSKYQQMHEQTRNNIVEKLTGERAGEILNDQMKMAILNMLKRNGPSSFGDIICELGISQTAGTNHIFELKLLGLIDKSADPPNYNIDSDRYAALLKYQKK